MFRSISIGLGLADTSSCDNTLVAAACFAFFIDEPSPSEVWSPTYQSRYAYSYLVRSKRTLQHLHLFETSFNQPINECLFHLMFTINSVKKEKECGEKT